MHGQTEQNRALRSRVNPHIYGRWIFNTGIRRHIEKRTVFSINGGGKLDKEAISSFLYIKKSPQDGSNI